MTQPLPANALRTATRPISQAAPRAPVPQAAHAGDESGASFANLLGQAQAVESADVKPATSPDRPALERRMANERRERAQLGEGRPAAPRPAAEGTNAATREPTAAKSIGDSAPPAEEPRRESGAPEVPAWLAGLMSPAPQAQPRSAAGAVDDTQAIHAAAGDATGDGPLMQCRDDRGDGSALANGVSPSRAHNAPSALSQVSEYEVESAVAGPEAFKPDPAPGRNVDGSESTDTNVANFAAAATTARAAAPEEFATGLLSVDGLAAAAGNAHIGHQREPTAAADGLAPAPDAPAARFEAHLDAALHSPRFAPALGAQVSVWVQDGVQQASLHLNPADMGPVAVSIALDGTRATVEFSAEMAATRTVLEASLPELAAALRESGLTLAGGGVFDRPRGQQGDGGDASSQSRFHSGASERGEGATTEPSSAPATRPSAARRGGIDLYA